jgi:hypothetical protein
MKVEERETQRRREGMMEHNEKYHGIGGDANFLCNQQSEVNASASQWWIGSIVYHVRPIMDTNMRGRKGWVVD